jgi:hypothetical protein
MIQNEVSKHPYTTYTYKDGQEKGHTPNNHYAYINNMSSFLKNKALSNNNEKKHVCNKCLLA